MYIFVVFNYGYLLNFKSYTKLNREKLINKVIQEEELNEK